MQSSSREKIAVVLFVAILGLVVVGLCAYLVVGHKWNTAATTIDDAAGDMAGYTTILFEGTSAPDYQDVDAPDAVQRTGVPLALVADQYREKKSGVIELDTVDEGRYATPRVVRCNDRRFGIVSFTAGQSTASMQAEVTALQQQGVDSIIAIVPYASLVSQVTGLDIVCNLRSMAAPASSSSTSTASTDSTAASSTASASSAEASSASSSSSSSDGAASSSSSSSESFLFGDKSAHVIATSAVGTVKAVIISPTNNVSTRVIDAL